MEKLKNELLYILKYGKSNIIRKFKLTLYDIRELQAIIFDGQNETINSKVVNVLKYFKINVNSIGIGYKINL